MRQVSFAPARAARARASLWRRLTARLRQPQRARLGTWLRNPAEADLADLDQRVRASGEW